MGKKKSVKMASFFNFAIRRFISTSARRLNKFGADPADSAGIKKKKNISNLSEKEMSKVRSI